MGSIRDRDDYKDRAEQMTRTYVWNSRGLGGGWGRCMVCGDEATIDCSGYVPSRETGEALVELFKVKESAYLDWRPFEPTYIQVKLHVCKDHEQVLADLSVRSHAPKGERESGGPHMKEYPKQSGISLKLLAELGIPYVNPENFVKIDKDEYQRIFVDDVPTC